MAWTDFNYYMYIKGETIKDCVIEEIIILKVPLDYETPLIECSNF